MFQRRWRHRYVRRTEDGDDSSLSTAYSMVLNVADDDEETDAEHQLESWLHNGETDMCRSVNYLI